MISMSLSSGNEASAALSGLAILLVRRRLMDQNIALRAMEQARQRDMPFVVYVVEQNLVRSVDIALLASQEFNLPLFDVSALELEAAPVTLVTADLIRRHHALPLHKRGNRLFVGISDPTNLHALEDMKFQSRLQVEPVVMVEPQLTKAIETALSQHSAGVLSEDMNRIGAGSRDEETATELAGEGDETPIVRFVNRTLLDAIHRRASDIHFEPYEKTYRVRFRQDGVLHEIIRPPVAVAGRIAARIKVMAQLDIAERRVPQDGRIRIRLNPQRAVDFRVSTLPTLIGEKVVLRILDPASTQLDINALGYEEHHQALFLKAIHKPQGMVLVTGPTGSGKTVSLYTALNILNTPQVNISTIEDPVEINLSGINQVNVNPKTGMTFANALRAFLRQDPDIIMVGEIRDLETAEIAIKAAQTGHMVLSTLHTNSAPETLTRLINMGVAPYNIASSVTLIIAQRLSRQLCHHCKAVDPVPPEELLKQGFGEDEIAGLVIYRAVGCPQCVDGYKGRTGVFEVMPVAEAMGRIMMAGGDSLQLAEQAQREGVRNLRQSGLNKVRQGVTSLEELNRVTKD